DGFGVCMIKVVERSIANSRTLTRGGIQWPETLSLCSSDFNDPLWRTNPFDSKMTRSRSSNIRNPGWWIVNRIVLPRLIAIDLRWDITPKAEPESSPDKIFQKYFSYETTIPHKNHSICAFGLDPRDHLRKHVRQQRTTYFLTRASNLNEGNIKRSISSFIIHMKRKVGKEDQAVRQTQNSKYYESLETPPIKRTVGRPKKSVSANENKSSSVKRRGHPAKGNDEEKNQTVGSKESLEPRTADDLSLKNGCHNLGKRLKFGLMI
nr:hypothetical protein [Tanacetum cinerariifolium]